MGQPLHVLIVITRTVAKECRDVQLVAAHLIAKRLQVDLTLVGRLRLLLVLRHRTTSLRLRSRFALETGSNDRYLNLFLHVLIDDGTEDHVYFRIGCGYYNLRSFIYLVQGKIRPAGNVHDNAARSLDGGLQQWAHDRFACRFRRTVLACSHADAHKG